MPPARSYPDHPIAIIEAPRAPALTPGGATRRLTAPAVRPYADARSRPGTYLTLPGHGVADADPVVRDGYWLHTAPSA